MDTISVCQRLVKEAWSTSAKWKENYAEATEVLQEAIALGSKDRNTFFNLGVALLNTSTREAAMVEFNKARNLTADARSLEAYFDPQAH
jgi:Flp pilus assembly protein TadD